MATHEELEKAFLAAPDAEGLVTLYQTLAAELRDDLLAAILDKIRPIQHRVTLIQADANPALLEALSRDPHSQVRQVVASHAAINDEVCLRLCEDLQQPVRLALRKNPHCHPVIQAALVLKEKKNESPIADVLVEMAWQARRCEFDAAKLVELIEDWTGVAEEELADLTIEQGNLILQVLASHLGQGPMPSKPRRARGR